MPCNLHTRLNDVVLSEAGTHASVRSMQGVTHGIGESNLPHFEHLCSLCSGEVRETQKLLLGNVVEVGACYDDRASAT